MAEEVVGEAVLEEIPDILTVGSDLDGPDTNIEDSGPVGIGVVAVGTDGIGLPSIGIRVASGFSRNTAKKHASHIREIESG